MIIAGKSGYQAVYCGTVAKYRMSVQRIFDRLFLVDLIWAKQFINF
jgi:hypothetical protein